MCGCVPHSTSVCVCVFVGTYGGSPGLTTPACSGACAAGYYCLEAADTSTAFPCGAVTVYCPPGSSNGTFVDLGYYTVGGNETTRQGEAVCPPGAYCQRDGYARPCPPGLYGSTPGLTGPACTGPCAPGHYCPQGSTNATAAVRVCVCGSACARVCV